MVEGAPSIVPGTIEISGRPSPVNLPPFIFIDFENRFCVLDSNVQVERDTSQAFLDGILHAPLGEKGVPESSRSASGGGAKILGNAKIR